MRDKAKERRGKETRHLLIDTDRKPPTATISGFGCRKAFAKCLQSMNIPFPSTVAHHTLVTNYRVTGFGSAVVHVRESEESEGKDGGGGGEEDRRENRETRGRKGGDQRRQRRKTQCPSARDNVSQSGSRESLHAKTNVIRKVNSVMKGSHCAL